MWRRDGSGRLRPTHREGQRREGWGTPGTRQFTSHPSRYDRDGWGTPAVWAVLKTAGLKGWCGRADDVRESGGIQWGGWWMRVASFGLVAASNEGNLI
jgi:hypothetical protein